MLKRFLISLLAFVTVFMYQSQSWASTENTNRIAETVKFDHDQATLTSDIAPYQIANKSFLTDMRKISFLSSIFLSCLASFLIPGFGQMLMGDFWRGFKFTITTCFLPVITFVLIVFLCLVFKIDTKIGSYVISLSYYVIATITLFLYAFNIIDAYNMSLDKIEMNEVDFKKISSTVEKQLEIINNSFKIGNNKVEIRTFSF